MPYWALAEGAGVAETVERGGIVDTEGRFQVGGAIGVGRSKAS